MRLLEHRPTGTLPSLACSLAVAVVGCGKPQAGGKTSTDSEGSPGWFRDVAATSGIRHTHDAGAPNVRFMPQIAGSGCALFDYDNDGRLDILLIQNGGTNGKRNQLFHQEPDGTFKDVSAGSGLDVAGYGMGVAVGDVNNDGFPDVVLTSYRGARLFLNHRDGTFVETTADAGIDDPHWATSAAFVDYDRDGWLDLVVVNYLVYDPARPCVDRGGGNDYCGPQGFQGTVTQLFHNRGGGRFEDVTDASGLGLHPGPGLGVLCLDFDGDGWPDVLVTDDGKPNRLFVNRHDGTFAESGVLAGIAYNAMGVAQANMGIAFAATDARLDVYVTHLTEETNVLWSSPGDGTFADRTAAAALAAPRWHATGFGTVMADFDNDGAADLAVVNGRVKRDPLAASPDSKTVAALGAHWAAYAERNQLFAGAADGSDRFRDVSDQNPGFCGIPNVARGLACGDVFNDGGVDLLVTQIAGPARLYRNVIPRWGHWLLVRATDPALGGRDAYGARVVVTSGGRRFVGWVNPGSSYLSSNDPRVHFGLGNLGAVDGIEVRWPDGSVERFPDCDADRVVHLERGRGVSRPTTRPATGPATTGVAR